MECAYLILEVKYSVILNFDKIAKQMLAPFAKNALNISIKNENTINELIQLNFIEDGYSCAFSSQGAYLWSDIESENLINNHNSPVNLFFDIVEKIKNLDTFGQFESYMFESIFLIESELLKDKKISQKTNKNNDLVIGFTNAKGDSFYESYLLKKYYLNFGEDNINNNIFLIKNLSKMNLENQIVHNHKSYYISKHKIFEKLDKNEFKKKLKSAFQQSKDHFNNLP